jgi:hypothetical protein
MKTKALLALATMAWLFFPVMTGARQDQPELIKGAIQGMDGKPLNVTTIIFLPKIPEGQSTPPKPIPAPVSPDGSFSLTLPKGDYLVATNPPCYKLKEQTIKGADTLSLAFERKSAKELADYPGMAGTMKVVGAGLSAFGAFSSFVGSGMTFASNFAAPINPGGVELALKVCGQGHQAEIRPKNNN